MMSLYLVTVLLLVAVTGNEIIGFSVVNTKTGVTIQTLSDDGGDVDLTENSSKDLALLVDTQDNIKYVHFRVDGKAERIENAPPFSLNFVDFHRTNPSASIYLYTSGMHEILTTVYDSEDSVLESKTITLNVIVPPPGTELYLVNTVNGTNVMKLTNGTIVDISVVGNALSICATTSWVIDYASFNLDSIKKYVDNKPPFSLGGDRRFGSKVRFFSVASLLQQGQHSLTVSTYNRIGSELDSTIVLFNIVNTKRNAPPPLIMMIESSSEPTGFSFLIQGDVRYWNEYNSDVSSPDTSYDMSLFQGHRWGPDFVYIIPEIQRTTWYSITLGLCETYVPNCNNGSRVMNVYVNGEVFHEGLDVYSSAGCNTGTILTKEFQSTSVSEIRIHFVSQVQNAMISFIQLQEVGSEITTPTPTLPPSSSPSPSFESWTKKPSHASTIEPSPTNTSFHSTPPVIRSSSDWGQYSHSMSGDLSGELRKWHKVTLGFEGPYTSETAEPNPFTHYIVYVEFLHGASGKSYIVPGYYGADGNAANTGATSGNVWLAHFTPDEVGLWNWKASFTIGDYLSPVSNRQSAGYFDDSTGEFEVEDSNKSGKDFRARGRLQYVGEHHRQFAETGEWFFKIGVDSPENFLAYEGFDNTPDNGGYRKSWEPHVQDYEPGDPYWSDGNGTGIIGAVNYLSHQGMNSISFLTMNIDGDDRNVFPYISDNPDDFLRIDVSKTAQWEILFEHADRMGMHLHFKTQEQENDQLLDAGTLGMSRRFYYRELIARFSHHLAITWNLGEENTNTDGERKDFSNFFFDTDPYKHLIVIHTFPDEKQKVYDQLLGLQSFTGVSLQSSLDTAFEDTLEWIDKSEESGHKWVVSIDEQNPPNLGVVPDSEDADHKIIRERILWANLLAGGTGVEYYFGYRFSNSDLSCQDYRSRQNMWDQSKLALDFLLANKIEFWKMKNDNSIVSNGNLCLKSGDSETIVIYVRKLPLIIDLDKDYTVRWFDPAIGGPMQIGETEFVSSGKSISLGNSPDKKKGWVVLLR